MATPMVMVIVALLLAKPTIQDQFAQECRVYEMVAGMDWFSTPAIPVQSLLTVSFYNRDVGDVPTNAQILLQGTEGTESIFISSDGDVVLCKKNFTLTPACLPSSWLSLAVLLQDQSIIIYRIDERETYISGNTSLGVNVTAKVSHSRDSLHVALNCPAGCLMHDNTSPLIRQWISLGDTVTIYISHEEETRDAHLFLGFQNDRGDHHAIRVKVNSLEPDLWHKVVIYHDKKNSIIVRRNGKEVGKVMIAEVNVTFAILNSTAVLWSLHCHPVHATGLEGWRRNYTDDNDNTSDEEEGAGIGEVLAWVLAGTALFLVMVMALLLCTKMGPKSDNFDYGASVGVVTSFGRQMTYRNAEREAEEDTEPDSPTFLAPVTHHKVPEEDEEHQSNTKML